MPKSNSAMLSYIPLRKLYLQLLLSLWISTSTSTDEVVHAIEPSCISSDGSTTCNIGINPPSSISLGGGYQWLTVESTTEVQSGTAVITDDAVWTATETNFLTATPVTTTDSNGITITATSTDYFSFVTATPTSNGVAGAPIIAAAVIAPALLSILQGISDAAASKTAETIASEIVAQAASKAGAAIGLTAALTMAEVLIFAKLAQKGSAELKVYLENLSVSPPTSTLPAAPTTTSTSSDLPGVTAIVMPPFPVEADLQYPLSFDTSGPTPTTDDPDLMASSTLPPLPTLSKQCYTSSLINCQYVFWPATYCPSTTEVLPASCTAPATTSSPPPIPPSSTAVPTPEPTKAPSSAYCVSTQPGTCMLGFISIYTPPDPFYFSPATVRMFVYDDNCIQIGVAAYPATAGMAIYSELPYTVVIKELGQTAYKRSNINFCYAGKCVDSATDTRACWVTDQSSTKQHIVSTVTRCQFDCSQPAM